MLGTVADPGGQIGPWPPSKLAMEFAPLEGRKRNDSTVNLWKSKGFALPYRCFDVGYGFAPLRKNTIFKAGKSSMTKKKVEGLPKRADDKTRNKAPILPMSHHAHVYCS